MITQAEIENKINKFPTICRQAGLKVTPQRMAVYNMLASTDSHPTPEAIYAAVRPGLPSISLGTVYKILDLLNLKGILRKVCSLDQAARYDARITAHHHTACTQCGRLEDLDIDSIPAELVGEESPTGFHSERIEVLVHGLCRDCRPRANQRKGSSSAAMNSGESSVC